MCEEILSGFVDKHNVVYVIQTPCEVHELLLFISIPSNLFILKNTMIYASKLGSQTQD